MPSTVSPFPSFRTRCPRWSVSCRPAVLTLWSACAPTPAASQTVLTVSMCQPSCSTSGCLRWCAWSVMDTLSACPSQAFSAGQCRNTCIIKSAAAVITRNLKLLCYLCAMIHSLHSLLFTYSFFCLKFDRFPFFISLSVSVISLTLRSQQVTVISVRWWVTGRAGQSKLKVSKRMTSLHLLCRITCSHADRHISTDKSQQPSLLEAQNDLEWLYCSW